MGEKVRIRLPKGRLRRDEAIKPFLDLYEEFNSISVYDDDESESDKGVTLNEIDIDDLTNSSHVCNGAKMVERSSCEAGKRSCVQSISGTPCEHQPASS